MGFHFEQLDLVMRQGCYLAVICIIDKQVTQWKYILYTFELMYTIIYEGSKTRSPLFISIDRNSICLPSFTSESFHSKILRNEEGFLTTTFKLGLLEKTVTT